jgi:hypothetical protein
LLLYLMLFVEHSFFSTPCSTLLLFLLLLIWHYLLNVPCSCYHCSCYSLLNIACSMFFAKCSLLTLLLLEIVPCLTLLLLLLLFLVQCYYSSWCSLLDVTSLQRCCFSYCLTLLLLLLFFIWHYCSSCLTLLQFCSFILNTICLNTYLLHYDVVLCSLFDVVVLALCFKLVFSPLVFLWEELSKFKLFKLDLESEIFFSNLCLLIIFSIIHVFGKFWLTMCLFVVCRNYLDILKVVLLCEPQQIQFLHLIIHIALHLHNYIVYFFNTLHLFLVFFRLFVNV